MIRPIRLDMPSESFGNRVSAIPSNDHPNDHPHDELRFQVSLLRLVYHGSLDGGPGIENGGQELASSHAEEVPQYVSRQIAEIEQLIAR